MRGVKDYLPNEQLLRNYIKVVLRSFFERYGYKPVETSILEEYDIALVKDLGNVRDEIYTLKDRGGRDIVLRYELTFKLAKLIAENPALRMPFKRYEIGKVFRDGPVKKGRLREFTQCDVDIVGIKDEYAEAELLDMALKIFKEFEIDVEIRVNHRLVLLGIIEMIGMDKPKDVALTIDKLDKIGRKGVIKELEANGYKKENIKKLFDVLDNLSSLQDSFDILKDSSEKIKTGLMSLRKLFNYLSLMDVDTKKIVFSPFLARGLNYYTGIIWEVYTKGFKSSIAAGGRWDNLIKIMAEKMGNNLGRDYPAVGMTFGLDTIYEVMKKKKQFFIPKLLIVPIGIGIEKVLPILSYFRKYFSTDISFRKVSSALEYASKENIPFVLLVGKKELEKEKYRLRDMKTGLERDLSLLEIKKLLNQS